MMKTQCLPGKKTVSLLHFCTGEQDEDVETVISESQIISRKHRVPALPDTAMLRGVLCSSAHITDNDNTLLYLASHRYDAYGDAEWVHYTDTRYLLRLNAWRAPVLRLKRLGISKACRRLIATLMEQYPLTTQHIDAAGDVLEGFDVFNW